MSQIVVKVTCKEETRRIVVNLVEGENPVEYIKSKCREYFNLKNTGKFNLNYTDADGDEITLTNPEELKNLIKLRLVKKCKGCKKKSAVVPESTEESPIMEAEQSAEVPNAPAPINKWFGKCKRKFEKENIVEIKVVKLAWQVGDETGYLVAMRNGKIAFKKRGRGLRGLWFLKKSDKGDIFCAPATAPKRHLRIMPQSFEINLNDGEMGPWSRWSFAPVGALASGININTLEDLVKSDVKVQFASSCHNGNVIAIKLMEKEKMNSLENKQKKVLIGVPSNESYTGSISIEAKINLDFLLFRFSKRFHKMGMGFGCRNFWRRKCWAKRFGMSKFGGNLRFGPHHVPHGEFGQHHGLHGGFEHRGPHGSGYGHRPFGGHRGGFGHHSPHGGPGFGRHGPFGGCGRRGTTPRVVQILNTL